MAVEFSKVDKATGLRYNQSIRLTVAKSRKNYPDKLRRIKYYDLEKDIRHVIRTNDFEMDTMEIATICKSWWQIEVFSNGSNRTYRSRRFGDIRRTP